MILYRRRGQAANHIKSWKTHLAADRTSCTNATAIKLRLFHSTLTTGSCGACACLCQSVQCGASRGSTRCACGSSRSTSVVEMKTIIRVHLPTSCPAQDILRLVLGHIPRLVT